jgi:hypothetical protein
MGLGQLLNQKLCSQFDVIPVSFEKNTNGYLKFDDTTGLKPLHIHTIG